MELKLVDGFVLIDGMEDFVINIRTNQIAFDENSNTNLILVDHMSTKKYLRIFIQNIIDESISKTKSDFISTIFQRKQFWRKIQYETITKLNFKIDSGLVSERQELETDLKRYLNLFHSIQRILEIAEIEYDKEFLKENIELPEIIKADGTKFTLNEIALIHIYKREPINKDNCHEIAKSYGWKGQKLLLNYNELLKNRLETSTLTHRTLSNRIDLINSIIDYLPEDKKTKPKDEIRKLETDLEEKRDY